MPPRRNPLEVQRNIHFYRALIGIDAAGRRLLYDPSPDLRALAGLDHANTGQNGPYLDTSDGNAVTAWVDSQNVPQRLRYVRVRKNGLPSLLNGGTLAPLNIPADSGLAEEVHAVFFGNNIVGSDFNFFGPRLTSLGWYIRRKTGTDVTFQPLLMMDATQRLARLKDISLFDLRITPSFASVVQGIDRDLGSAFSAAIRAGESDEAELVLRPRPRSGNTLRQRLLTTVRALARRTDIHEGASEFKVRGLDATLGRNAVIDVLSDRLVASKRMLRQNERSRSVQPDSAYAAIAEAFEELGPDLRDAAALEP